MLGKKRGSIGQRFSPALQNLIVLGATFSILATLSAACKSSSSSISGGSSGGATGSSGSSGSPTPIGVVDNSSGLTVYANFQPAGGSTSAITSFLHEQSSLTSNCAVQPSQVNTNSANLYCILDVAEEDLYVNDLSLILNVPQGMCPYTTVKLYSFYQYSVGPEQAQNIVVTQQSGSSTCTITGGSFVGGGCSGNPYCPYDHSIETPPGPNCCTGTAAVTTITEPAVGSTAPATSSTSTVDFGGNPALCLAGPDGDVLGKDKNQYPVSVIYRTIDSGTNVSLNMKSPLHSPAGPFLSNLYVANYFDPTQVSSQNATYPPSAGLFPTADAYFPYYEFNCTDDASDSLARIRLLIRPWDRVSDFTAYTNPYDPGTEPIFGGPFHDFDVWQDYLTTYIGAYL